MDNSSCLFIHSTFGYPRTAHRLHYRCTRGTTAHMKQKLLENESDVKPRSDWFTSEGHFAPDSRSTCRIYHRKSPTFRSRGIPAFPSTFFLASTPKIPSLPGFVKSTGITNTCEDERDVV